MRHVAGRAFAAVLAIGIATASSPATAAAVPGSAGTWAPYGTGSLLDNTRDYTPIDAIPTMSGRIQGITYDPADLNHLYVAVGSGGIWESHNLGADWHSVSEGVPTTQAGSVIYTHTGVLIDGTGDSGYGYMGKGIWWSADDGGTWHKASGVPDGAATYQMVTEPGRDSTVYAATTKGLYKSLDSGASWINLELPTGPTYTGGPDCKNHVTDPTCFFNNWVTAVAVRPADTAGGPTKVIAAVGWFRGSHHFTSTPQGWDQGPGNGIYVSPDGSLGSFTRVQPLGFTPQSHIGTTSLTVASGPTQNHDVVWSMVSDAQKVDGNPPLIDPVPGVPSALGAVYPTTLDGIYMSSDFGQSWTKKIDSTTLASCTTGTDQCGYLAAPGVSGYAPGVQSWYNNWIKIDPTQQDGSGIPTRLAFGIEEIWEIPNANLPGPSNPKVIGRYFGDPFCPYTALPANTPGSPCPPTQQATPSTTHPDQHSGLFVPDAQGGVSLMAGNDGGLYIQHIAAGADFDNQHWGQGANNGLHTLLPYMAVMAKDGVAYAGLQDNGEDKVFPNGRQVEVFGGDGTYSAVDPNDSNFVYESYVTGQMSVSTDGGHNWTSINPSLTSGQFVAPFAMDPTDRNHVVIGGQDIEETTSGPNTTTNGNQGTVPNAATDWTNVYTLPTNDQMSAVDVRSENIYVAYCGPCYLSSLTAPPLAAGIATNVGGAQPAHLKTSDGWHAATATGLPTTNYITHIEMDPANVRTVYVTLGDESNVTYRPSGWAGQDLSKISHRHVYKSVNAGASFRDISGNLPDVFTNWVTVHGNQLLVATNEGAYISSDLDGTSWAPLGTGLPGAPVYSITNDPGNSNRALAATYGRGLYLYTFADPAAAASTPAPAPSPSPKVTLPSTPAGATDLRELLPAIGALVLLLPLLLRRRRVV